MPSVSLFDDIDSRRPSAGAKAHRRNRQFQRHGPGQPQIEPLGLALANWYQAARRDLPWRSAGNENDPYCVLVSEIMLQQTTVAAVGPIYTRFLGRFPSLASLAAAPLDEVLAMWAGLGYYQRARALHACARRIAEQYGGAFPTGRQELLDLPGIGRYTAGAVLSLAFNRREPILDANVARVVARLWCVEEDLKSPTAQRALWGHASSIVQTATPEPRTINSALMELGALICTARNPRCQECPVSAWCAARAAGRENELPRLPARRAPVEVTDACLLATNWESGQEKLLLRQRSHERGVWWRGMWELPRVRLLEGESPEEGLRRLSHDELDSETALTGEGRTLRHTVTHHKITLHCLVGTVAGDPKDTSWVTHAELQSLAMPSVMSRLTEWWFSREAVGGHPSLF